MTSVNEQPDATDLEQADEKEIYSLRDLSETVLGMIAEGWLPHEVVEEDWFAQPFNKGIKLLKHGAVKDDLNKVLPNDLLISMHNKVMKMNGSRALYDWPKMLKGAYDSWILGEQFERTGYLLKQNKPVDIGALHQRTSDFMTRGTNGIRKASEIDYQSYVPFMKSGDPLIDKLIGGIPTDGPIIVMGDTGTGKSFWGAKQIAQFLLAHPDQTAAAYSFEMNERHWLKRAVDMFPALFTQDVIDRLYVSGSVDKPTDLVPEVMTHEWGLVLIDDMDNMVDGEAAAGKYEAAFKVIKKIARLKSIPVIALSQAKGREMKATKFLTKYDVAWSSAGENSAAMLIALQNAGGLDKGWQGDDTYPITDDQMQYTIFLKSRDGWPMHTGPCAIVQTMEMDSANKHKHSIWSGPLYKGLEQVHRPARHA